jgi:hypothetical protein
MFLSLNINFNPSFAESKKKTYKQLRSQFMVKGKVAKTKREIPRKKSYNFIESKKNEHFKCFADVDVDSFVRE